MRGMANEHADYLRQMADELEKGDGELMDFIAFFHIHPLNDGDCGVVPIGFILPDGHLMDFLGRFLMDYSKTIMQWLDNGEAGVIFPMIEDGKVRFQLAHYESGDDDVDGHKDVAPSDERKE
jgi:hypothetical protein